MREGTYTFYIIEQKIIAETAHGDVDGSMIPFNDDNQFAGWHPMCRNNILHIAEPWVGSHARNRTPRRPLSPKSEAETAEIAQITSFAWHGWWTLKYAIRGLRRILKAYDEGKFHYRSNPYDDDITTRLQLEFRVSKVTLSKKIEPVDINEVVKSL